MSLCLTVLHSWTVHLCTQDIIIINCAQKFCPGRIYVQKSCHINMYMLSLNCCDTACWIQYLYHRKDKLQLFANVYFVPALVFRVWSDDWEEVSKNPVQLMPGGDTHNAERYFSQNVIFWILFYLFFFFNPFIFIYLYLYLDSKINNKTLW